MKRAQMKVYKVIDIHGGLTYLRCLEDKNRTKLHWVNTESHHHIGRNLVV